METEQAHGQVFNIGSTDEISILELAERVRRLIGSKSEIVTVPYDEAYEEGFEDIARRLPDTTKVADLLGWRPANDLDRCLADVAEHQRNGDVSGRNLVRVA
jgi:UDP-glucose 4-epimerase